MIRLVRALEAGQPLQHPIGMTFQFKGGSNRDLFRSPTDWISPNPDGGYERPARRRRNQGDPIGHRPTSGA